MPRPFNNSYGDFNNRPSSQRDTNQWRSSSETPDPVHDTANFSPCGGGHYRDDRTGKIYDWTGDEIDE